MNQRQVEDTLRDTLLGYSHITRIVRNAILDMKQTISSTPLDISKDYIADCQFPLRKLRQQMVKLQLMLQDMDQISEIIDFKIEALNQRCKELVISASLLVCDRMQHVEVHQQEDNDTNELSSQILKEKEILEAIE